MNEANHKKALRKAREHSKPYMLGATVLIIAGLAAEVGYLAGYAKGQKG